MRRRLLFGALLSGLAVAFFGLAQGQQVFHDGFETHETVWNKGAADAPFRELVHDLTDRTAHNGQSEHLQLEAERGNYIYYVYPIGRAPVTEELNASIWIKANRPGAQFMARLILPHEPNPAKLDERLATYLRGEQYTRVGRWERLDLRRPVKLMAEQQQLMRAKLKKDVNFADAYIDELVLNVYGGPGANEIWIDDLEVGPVLDRESVSVPSPGSETKPQGSLTTLPRSRAKTGRSGVVEFRHYLLVNDRRFFFRAIQHSDTPLEVLRETGFNTLFLEPSASPKVLQEALDLGFWVVPSLPAGDAKLASADQLQQEMNRFLASDAVLFWDLGNGLVQEQGERVTRTVQAIRSADPQHPTGADVWDGLQRYSLNLDLLGAHRWNLMTTLEMSQYRTWLEQRRQLARPGTFLWTWVQTHLPDWYTHLIYDHPAAAGFKEPVGPQPEQIRLLTYTALAAGCRGLGFWSDRFLADSHQGRDRLLQLALLNLELQMLEPLLVAAETPRWIATSNPEVQAAVLRTPRGVLVLPIWFGRGSQFVPGQDAVPQLKMIVPEVPHGAQAWEISPARVRSLPSERTLGGVQVAIPEFSLTSAIVFTSDLSPTGLVVRFQDLVDAKKKMAAQYQFDLAKEEWDKVSKVEARLEKEGHSLPDAQRLLENSRLRLKDCVKRWNDGEFSDAYFEAERALRPLRILMRAHFDEAVKALDTPVASPYAVSFFTLPWHWRFMERVQQALPAPNVLPDGGFEQGPDGTSAGWQAQATTLDDVETSAPRTVADLPKEGNQCLLLQVKPKNPSLPEPAALERTILMLTSPPVQVRPGTLVQISGWVRIPKRIAGSPDGVLFYDSIGGEPLAVRLTEPTGWKKFTLYRIVPPSGNVRVTLALTGLGSVYFDDVRIEPLVSGGTTVLRQAASAN